MTTTFTPETPRLADLHELEHKTQELWSIEPMCDPAQRTLLLTRLSRVTRRLDHLVFRQQFHPDEPIDGNELRRCAHQVRELAARWTSQRPRTALVA